MHVFVINPNSTASMTDTAVESARRVAGPLTVIEGATGIGSPASIEGFSDEALSVPSMLAQIRMAEAGGAQATVIACFDDPGLDAAREIASGPVIGICQAGVQAAMVLAKRFSIVTTLPRSVPAIEDLVHRYGASQHCRRVRCIDLPVLALETETQHAFSLLVAEIERARDEDGAEAVVLGCAGMSEMTDDLTKATGVVVIDGVIIATKMAEALIGSGLRTSKANAYGFPRIKD
ncbi:MULTISPECIES: aspartate/glutamate racemase family protein [Paracoccus]|uniref:Hydantoin racemase n=1 Tax=Paracoccus litorisediminis TaxID=2006130 RepID=A0A844HPM6_9RHOB|nr:MULTISPECIES: aspartate/glutamate racemase family protein [Paracoccus]MBD9527671.1 aspartate/glutamate racemase family protein [Paracoccus sp. PAR01]MTH60307.1 aspartate/glutamate racemase family protein [Paracoccus litorisediminis]